MWLVLIQVAALAAVIELFVQCMPSTLRRASLQNCYRVDGTKSEHRSYREWRARNRVRRDMLAVLVLVFLTGNALFFTMENSGTPIKSLGSLLWKQVTVRADKVPDTTGVGTAESTEVAAAPPVNWLWPAILLSSWATCSIGLVGWGAFRAYRSFAEGVNARSAEHFHLDMTRMSVNDSQSASARTAKSDSNSGADVA